MDFYLHGRCVRMLLAENAEFASLPPEITKIIVGFYRNLPHAKVNVNKYGGISWNICVDVVSYIAVKKFVEKISAMPFRYIDHNNGVKKDEMVSFGLISTNIGRKFFELIKKNNKFYSMMSKDKIVPWFDIDTENKYERKIIYTLCRLFGMKFETIIVNTMSYIPCTKFADKNSWQVCGCDNAPRWFHKNHSHNNYEDTIAYSKGYKAVKTGVRVFKI